MSIRIVIHRPVKRISARWPLLGVLAVCFGLLIVSAGLFLWLGPYALAQSLLLQLGLVSGFALLLFLFRHPQAGTVLVLVGGILVSWEIGTGTQSDFNAAILLSPVVIVVWLLHLVFDREQRSPVPSRPMIPLYLFMTAACLAFVVGQYPWFLAPPAPMRAQLGQLAVFLFSGGIFLAAAYHLQDTRWLKRTTYLFVGMASVYLVSWIVPGSALDLSVFLHPAVTGGSMFWTWLVALSCGQAVMNRELGPWPRLAMAAVALAAVAIGLAHREWLSGWVPALISVFVILLLRFPVPVLLASPVFAVLAVLRVNYLSGLVTTGDNLYSYETRVAAVKSLLPILSANPILGLGPANYYHYSFLKPIEGWYVKFNSHNNYVDLVAQTGFVGLACFLWFAWAVCRTAWTLQRKPLMGFERAYVSSVFAGLLASLAVAGLGDWIIPFVYNTGFAGFRTSVIPWIFMGGLVALERGLGRAAWNFRSS